MSQTAYLRSLKTVGLEDFYFKYRGGRFHLMIEPDLAFCSLNSIFTVPATNVKATHVPLPSAPGHPVPRGHGSLEPYPFSSPKILQQWRDPELDLCGTDCPVLQGGIGRRMREGHRFSQDTTLGEEVSGAVIAQPETQLRAGSAGAHEFILQGDSLRPRAALLSESWGHLFSLSQLLIWVRKWIPA